MTLYKSILYITISFYFLSLPMDGFTIEYLPITLSRITSFVLIFLFLCNLLLKKKLYFIKDKSLILLMLFLYFATFSIIWSDEKSSFYSILIFITMIFSVYSIVELVVSNKLNIRMFFTWYVVGALIAAYIAINNGAIYSGRFTITENYNPNTFSAELLIALSAIIYLWKKNKKIYNLILSISFIFLMLAIVLTQSRNTLLALILSLFIVVFTKKVISLKKGVKHLNFKNIINKTLFVFSFLFIGFLLIKNAINILELTSYDIRRLTSEVDDSSGRDQIWNNYIKIIQEKFLLGIGFMSSEAAYYDYYSKAVPPHNNFIRVFVELGVIGFLMYLAFFGSLVSKFKFSFVGNAKYVYLYLISFMFFSGIGNDSFYYRYFWSAWLFAYLIVVEEKNGKYNTVKEEK